MGVPRIERSVIPRLDPPVNLPRPATRPLKPPVVNVPSYDIPSYEPIDYNEDELEIREEKPPKAGGKRNEAESGDVDSRELPAAPEIPQQGPPKQEAATIQVPFVDYELPVPRAEQVALAGTTAFASVGATLLGKALVDQLVKILKPVVKQLLLRIRALLSRDRTQYEEQQILAFEGEAKLVKRLKKEQKRERTRQRAEAGRPLHQRILRGKESQDET